MNCMTKLVVGVVGYNGRMGKEILSVLKEKNLEYLLNDDKEELFKNSDVVIDFSSNVGLEQCLEVLNKINKPFVSGSTPMNDKLYHNMIELSKNNKICWSANMSIGIMIAKKMSFLLGSYLKENEYDCEILELHHNKKNDAPSGTAKLLGQSVAEGRKVDFNKKAVFNRSKKREIGEIGFSSIRGGSIFGEHEVMFIGENEQITIKHTAFNRKLFAVGAVECALKLLEVKENGFYLPEDLLFTEIRNK